MPRRSPAYRGTRTRDEVRDRFERIEWAMSEIRQEISSLFSLVLENRSRLGDLEKVKRVPYVKRSRRRTGRRKSR